MKNERVLIGDRVTIYQRGKKEIWCADFWQDGQHRRQSLKTPNKKVAVERATKLAATLVDGSYHQPLPALTIAETVQSYIDNLVTENRSRRTIVKYRGIFDSLVAFLSKQGVTRMGQFSAVHFDRYRAHLRSELALKTLYDMSIIVKQFYRWAKRRKMVLENPLEDIKLSKPKLSPKAGPELQQLDTVLAATRGRLRAMIAMLAFTGMRSGELQRLRQEDVDLRGNWIHIVSRPGLETKTRQSRKVPIHPRLRAILEALPPSEGPWYFTADPSPKYPAGGHWINNKKLNDRFASVLKKLNMPVGIKSGFVIHSLRHSFETITVNARIPQRVVDAWLGHTSDRSMGAVYYRLSDEESLRFMLSVPFGTSASAASAEKERAS
jgi:integrase